MTPDPRSTGTHRSPAQRWTALLVITVALTVALTVLAASAPFLLREGPGPSVHLSVRGEPIELYGYGPYRHMPAEVAVQGLAQDGVTLLVAVPFVLIALAWARRGSRAGHLALCGGVGYLLVQYLMYLAMATYNELFLLWTALVLLSSQAFVRLLLARPASSFTAAHPSGGVRRFVGWFLILNGTAIALLWLGTLVPPLISGRLYPRGLAHLTTMVVQGFDLALFIPPSLMAGAGYLRGSAFGALMAPVYAVFLSLQMTALLAKIGWMSAVGVSAGPALVMIPVLLVGALAASVLALRPHVGVRLDVPEPA